MLRLGCCSTPVFLASLLVLHATNNSLATDESSDWRRLSDIIVSEEEITSLIDQMALIGLSPLRSDPRVFQPDPEKRLKIEQLPQNIPPFGLMLSSHNTPDGPLGALKGHRRLFSLSLNGFENGKTCVSAIREQTSLRFLSVTDCGLTDSELAQLNNLQHLETLDLRRTKIRGPGLAELRSLAQLKSLEIDMTADQFHALKTSQLVHLLPIAQGENRSTAAKDEEITELELNGFYGYPVTDEMLRDLQYLTSLSKLSLIEAEITDDVIPELVRLPCLQELNLERTRIKDVALRELAMASLLKSLVLDETEVTPVGLQQLAKLESLNKLYLNRCVLDDESLKVLGSLPALERLEIGGTQICFERELAPGLFPKLRYLNVNGSKVTDSGIVEISGIPELRWLDLTLCRIDDKGLMSLRNCRNLEVLYLNLTPIADEALGHVASIATLQVLSLNSTGVTDAGLKHLSKSKNLKSLILLGTKVSTEAVQQLQSELPECEIVW